MSIIPGIFSDQSDTDDLFSLELWDLFQSRQFNSNNSQLLSDDLRPLISDEAVHIDWEETPTAHIFKSNVPGLKKVEVKVEVEDGKVLEISGETSREMKETKETWHCVEYSGEKFVRSFKLPENAKVDEAKAAMEDGVLIVTVPKVVEEKPNKTCVCCHEDAYD